MRRGLVLGFVLVPAVLACGRDESTDASGLTGLTAEEAIKNPDALAAPAAKCTPAKAFRGAAWPEADALFHREPRWLGADAAYSIALAPGRILWLFGDSFIAKTDAHVRSASTFVRNSIAIQTGTDPTKSTIAFHWQETRAPAGAVASSFFPEAGTHWFWPLHGARIPGGELVVFLNELERAPAGQAGLGFASVGTRMARIANPDADPTDWQITMRALPVDARSHGVGVVVSNGYLHSLTTKESAFFDVELERWKLDALDADAAFWNGKAFGVGALAKGSTPIWKGGAPEFETAAHCGEWLTVESVGFGATDVAIRRAPTLVGPWTAPVSVFTPAESKRAKPFVYAGKLHAEQTGADLVATYAANSFDFNEVINDRALYWPRFVKITEAR